MSEVTVTTTEVVATEPAKVKPLSKMAQATAIFRQKMEDRAQGLFASNRDFRAAVISTIKSQLQVSLSSAATMYNSAKKAAEAVDPNVGLGRDPKKVAVVKVSTGKRGRPLGSKNKPKAVVTVVQTSTEPTVVVMETPVQTQVEQPVEVQQEVAADQVTETSV